MNRNHNQRRGASALMAGWCALLLYAGAYSPLGLGVATLAGLFDRSHHITMQGSGPGLQLVLQHGRDCTGHHHGVVARALTAFARPASATNPDHVIQFSAADTLSRQAQLTAPSPETFARPHVALNESLQPSSRERFFSSIPTHPPPDDCGPLLCLRSTLLLI